MASNTFDFNNIKEEFQRNFKPNSTRTPFKFKTVHKILLAFFIIIALLALFVFGFSYIWTEYLWFDQVKFESVFWVQNLMPIILFVGSFTVAFIILFLIQQGVYKSRPSYNKDSNEVASLGRQGFHKIHNIVFSVISFGLAFSVGINLSSNWKNLLLMVNGQSFGKTDPVFNLDYSFYVFLIPGILVILKVLATLFFTALALTIIYSLIFKNISLDRVNQKTSKLLKIQLPKLLIKTTSKVQLSVWTLLFVIVIAAINLLSRFTLLSSSNGRFTGVDYVTDHIVIPGVLIFTVLLVLLSLSIIRAIFCSRLKLLIVNIVLLGVVGVLAYIVLPTVFSALVVNPNAQELESPYIQRNIDSTKFAYGIDKAKIQNYSAKTQANSSDIEKDTQTTMQIRLIDPTIVSPTFRQVQQIKQYYDFPNTLSVDKYIIDGKSQDTVIAAREMNLDGNSNDQRNWVNDHTVYTHGYGVVAAYGNKISKDGTPLFFEKDIPNVGSLTTKENYEPRIYFSPSAPKYSIVGGASNQKDWEFDYPSDSTNSNSSGATTRYKGDGGPVISNSFQKLLYAIRYQDINLLFSDRVQNDSQILTVRNPFDRVKKIAPYLSLDGRTYPAVIDGKVVWIIDGYTTSDSLPYSQTLNFSEITKDSITNASNSNSNLNVGSANYIRNSVKATVDAFSGEVTLYTFDNTDPILKTWKSIFPGTIKELKDVKGSLMSHFRYPESLFKIQRNVLATYHIDNSYQYFSGEDFWHIPNDPTDNSGLAQPPYYLTTKMPGVDTAFSLTSAFIPGGESKREILTGFLAASSDAGNKDGVIGDNYGKLNLLVLPKNSTVPGPGQTQNNFNSNAIVSQALNLLQTGSSNVERGNLLTLPVAGGLVYVQPVYVKSSGDTSFPLLKKVLVAFGDSIGFDDTLEGAMKQVFGSSAGVSSTSSVTQKQDNTSSSTSTSNSKLEELSNTLQEIAKANQKANEALKKGDWVEFGRQQDRINELVRDVK